MMTIKKDEVVVEDYWAKIFALHIGCPCPNERTKHKFVHFILENKGESGHLTEEFIFNQFPQFINYLSEY